MSLFLKKEDYIKAFELNGKALEIYLKICGDSSTSVAKCYANIAAICEVADEYKLALKNYKKAYKISKKLLGNKNPMTNFYFNKISDICKTVQS